MPKIHCINNISKRGTDQLPASYSLTEELSEADGILVRSASLHETEFPKSLLAIARAGAGVNNIPLDRCADEGIVVFNAPGANANAVKEIVICSMLLASRGIIEGIQWVRDNASDPDIAKSVEKVKKQFAGREIQGKKLGVIGLGQVGALVANAGVALGMDVYGYDPYLSVNAAWRLETSVHPDSSLDDICQNCDYITIHVPAMPATIGMIGEHEISLMKSDAVFLNFSRDTLVDNKALVAALEAGKLGCYFTDFATPEVANAQHVYVTPHLGASTTEAEENCAIMAANEIVDYIENGNIRNSVNFPACDMGPCPAEGSRIAVLHKNVPGIISGFSDAVSNAGINVDNMTSKARGDYAYAMLDVNGTLSDEIVSKIENIEGVIRVRVIK